MSTEIHSLCALFVGLVCFQACGSKPAPLPLGESAPAGNERPSASESGKSSAAAVPHPEDTRVRVERLTGSDPALFVARGQAGPKRLVFLHGMCGHAQGYAQSFQYAAARWGRLIAPQGDVPCGAGPWAKWSADLGALELRLLQGFAAVGAPEAPAVVIGYSQGATRAEQLARERPDRYAWLVSIAAPRAPSPRGLGQLKGAVMMAGERDRQDTMQAATAAFNRAGIPTTFIELPNARHGSMGATPELSMARAFDWIFAREHAPAPRN